MINALAGSAPRILPMAQSDVDQVRELEAEARKHPQVPIATDHVLHGGMYARTITIPAGVMLTGVLIRVPTTLVLDGDVTVNGGKRYAGRLVIAASAHRRQAFVAHCDTHLTMICATDATSVEEAEEQFTDEAHLLFSRAPDAVNTITVTGE